MTSKNTDWYWDEEENKYVLLAGALTVELTKQLAATTRSIWKLEINCVPNSIYYIYPKGTEEEEDLLEEAAERAISVIENRIGAMHSYIDILKYVKD